MADKQDEILERLNRLVVEVECCSDRLFILALPVYLSIFGFLGALMLRFIWWLGSGPP